MLRSICALLWVIAAAASASAVTLSVTSNKTTYAWGETITLTVIGDPEGAAALGIFGQLDFSAPLGFVSSTQTPQPPRVELCLG